MKLKLETKYTENFIKKHEYDQLRPFVELSNQILENKSGAGNDFLGWVDLPKNYDKEEFVRIQKAAEKIKNDSVKNNRRTPFDEGKCSAGFQDFGHAGKRNQTRDYFSLFR